MSENKELVKKLEAVNRENQKSDDRVVRKGVVAQRKKELARTVSDLDDMLQGLHAKNDFRIKRCKIEAEEEQVLQGILAKLQTQVKDLLATNPEECSDDQMASLASKIESTRRALLRIQLSNDPKEKFESNDSVTPRGSFLLLSSWQMFKLAFVISFPIVFTLTLGFLLIALVLGAIFGV